MGTAEGVEQQHVRPSRLRAHSLEAIGGDLVAQSATRDMGPLPFGMGEAAQVVGDHALDREFRGGRWKRASLSPSLEQGQLPRGLSLQGVEFSGGKAEGHALASNSSLACKGCVSTRGRDGT